MRLPPTLLLLSACGLSGDEPVLSDVDPVVVGDTLETARPEPLMDLIDDPGAMVGGDAGCPRVEILSVEPGVVHEQWHGGCRTQDGTTVRGRLERYDAEGTAWLASEGFTVRRDGVLVFAMSGSVELREQGELALVDAATTWCGGDGPACADGPVPVDLAFTIFPLSGYPAAYDGTVTGAVGVAAGVATVEGAWSVDRATCATEHASGTFAIRSDQRHALVMDGASVCDSCAAWTVDGQPAPRWCLGADAD